MLDMMSVDSCFLVCDQLRSGCGHMINEVGVVNQGVF